ncbi:hypothetical protein BROUX41_001252 [Berkeleyomyces rouxiae]|uniref:uncharacterized protein n=1 Tax=Berkeleyomyces rouxiae TaxID=2035830 RepID=UPI003B81D8DC
MASISTLPLGAIIQSIHISGLNVVQGFDTPEQYQQHNSPYFGETIGRVANRIKGACIASLNGQRHALAPNNAPNSLHGGTTGWGKKLWARVACPAAPRKIPGVGPLERPETVVYSLTSDDGDEGFPGAVEVRVIYTSGLQRVEGREVTVLAMEYQAELTGGAEETVINMTNHSYFNLAGAPTIEGTQVTLSTDQHLPMDATGIPTSGPTAHSEVRAHVPFTLGASSPRLDDCFVLDATAAAGSVPLDTRAEPLRLLVAARHPASGVSLQVLSTEPAFQFYTGEYVRVPPVGGLPARGARSGFCCEPGRFVNAVNEEAWRAQVVLGKGQTFGARTVYRAWKD